MDVLEAIKTRRSIRHYKIDPVDERTLQVVLEAAGWAPSRVTPRKALAFARRALDVVAAGRPPCPFCGQPLSPEGHICARRNGFMH